MNKEKALAYLEEVSMSYTSETRSFNPITSCCMYLSPSGFKKCAVGIKLTDAELKKVVDYGLLEKRYVHLCEKIETPEFFRDLEPQFVAMVQELHDTATCWSMNGLSHYGLERVEAIRKHFEL